MPSQPPPTPLTIATNALSRLLKEEASYETELAKQKFQRVVAKATTKGGGGGKGKGKGGVDMEDGEEEGGNAEWRVRQEVSCWVFFFVFVFFFEVCGGGGIGVWGCGLFLLRRGKREGGWVCLFVYLFVSLLLCSTSPKLAKVQYVQGVREIHARKEVQYSTVQYSKAVKHVKRETREREDICMLCCC